MAATGIYLPDPPKATAGIQFVKVLETLGMAGDLASRLHPYPNGAAAMPAMAQSQGAGPVGCTQVTEILLLRVSSWRACCRRFGCPASSRGGVHKATEPDAARGSSA